MTTHDLERLARESIDAFNRGDWSRLREMVAPDYTYEETGTGRVITGIDEVIAALQEWKTSAPDVTGEVARVLTDGTTTAVEICWQGTQTGPLNTGAGELPPSGLPFRTWATMWTRWQDGRAVDDRHHLDMLGMLAQVGALPAPSAT